MNLLASLKKMFHKPAPPPRPIAAPALESEAEVAPDAIHVPEVATRTVLADLNSASPPLLLDVREPYEWRQVHIVDALHIPMNSIPDRLEELPRTRPIVVICAHGSRSFGVAYFLRERGFDAYNLTGGLTQWHIHGGAVSIGTG